MSLSAFLSPGPVKVATNAAREALDFDASVSIYAESVVNGEEEESSQTRLVVVEGLQNLTCRIYPIRSSDTVGQFETSRNYTDRILIAGFFPRINSSHIAQVTRTSGEQAFFIIEDTEKSGDDRFTTLLVRTRLDRK